MSERYPATRATDKALVRSKAFPQKWPTLVPESLEVGKGSVPRLSSILEEAAACWDMLVSSWVAGVGEP